MNNKNMSNIKPIISIGDLAKALNHSRARFYQLQKEMIYPPPLYDIRTKRPFYDAHLQQICHEVRASGIGWNGRYILFYSPRKNNSDRPTRKSNSKNRELVMTLNNMGLHVSHGEVADAVKELYPQGFNQDTGVVIRELFRFFKQGM
ncbi:MAG: hypothetical protein FVQ85_04470 [Planctomycetes bacterium]|nr:hypothetical protein [Planctomycetota bacterium]